MTRPTPRAAQIRDPQRRPGGLPRERAGLWPQLRCRTDDHSVLPIGKARIMREGSDVTIVSYSIGVGLALEAAETLAG
jgi:pyruvate/2-oxoglutarate/acetoin dehydrogenase E1 component